MRYNRNRAIVILLLGVIILLATSAFITPTTISDTDPSTYVIVPILMMPLFLLFVFKTDIEPKVNRRDAAIGALAFTSFIVLTVLLRLYFSVYFVSFRIDMLLMPLGILALVSLLFGSSNISRFKSVMLYSLLASPAVMFPIINAANGFTNLNTLLVYNILKLFISGVQYSAPLTISANGYNIGIGNACVSIGIFIALALFLIPVAYFYNGKDKKKVYWVFSGVILLLVLNLLRMLGISFVWLTYGANSTALFVHTFIGVVLFYLVIVVMILVTKFYGMDANPVKQRKKRVVGKRIDIDNSYVFAAFAFSFIYLLLTINYSTSLKISPISLMQNAPFNFTNVQISGVVQDMVKRGNFSSLMMVPSSGEYVIFHLMNSTFNSTNSIMFLVMAPSANMTRSISKNNTVLGSIGFFNNKGSTEQVYDVISDNEELIVYNTNMQLALENASTVTMSIYAVVPADVLPNVTSCSSYDPIYSGVMNLVNPANYNRTVMRKIVSEECIFDRIVWD
jgi:exosortase/archaeosortase family protein